MPPDTLTQSIIAAAIDVHRLLGPGLLESSYQHCLAHELTLRSIPFERERPLPVHYKGHSLDCAYRLDFLVASAIVLEIKSVDSLAPIHTAQLLTYLRLGGWPLGLLMNFNVPLLKQGLRRIVLSAS
jgi:GxxExxY protein